MSELVAALPPSTVDEAGLAGEWELVYSDVELFRSSPFFLAIEVLTRRPAQAGRRGPCRALLSPHALRCCTVPRPSQAALDSSPGIPQLGKWLGLTDPTKKSALFFKLHQLQVSCRQRTAPHASHAHPRTARRPQRRRPQRRPCSAAASSTRAHLAAAPRRQHSRGGTRAGR